MDIARSYIGIRNSGGNQGFPSLHIEVKTGSETMDSLLASLLSQIQEVERFFVGFEVVQGLGSFLKGLGAFRKPIEVQIDGDCSTPSWINNLDKVIVIYREKSKFNYYTLKKVDRIVFRPKTVEDIETLEELYRGEYLLTPAVKWIEATEDIYSKALDLTLKLPRCGLSLYGLEARNGS